METKELKVKSLLYSEAEILNALGIKGKLKRFYHSITNDTFEFEMIEEVKDVQDKEVIS